MKGEINPIGSLGLEELRRQRRLYHNEPPRISRAYYESRKPETSRLSFGAFRSSRSLQNISNQTRVAHNSALRDDRRADFLKRVIKAAMRLDHRGQ
jgi:hypothetical protein